MSSDGLGYRLLMRAAREATVRLARRQRTLVNRAPLISFTFDDFPRSALTAGGNILRKYGVTGTFYAAFGLMGQAGSPVGPMFTSSDIAELLESGHELGCHTFRHCNAWTTPPAAFEQSIRDNHRTLRRIAPHALFSTLSYPLATPQLRNKRCAGRYFAACRGGGQTFAARSVDLNLVPSYFIEQAGGDSSLIRDVIERNRKATGWLVFSTHDIAITPSRFGCTPRFFEDTVRQAIDSGASLLPVGKALLAATKKL